MSADPNLTKSTRQKSASEVQSLEGIQSRRPDEWTIYMVLMGQIHIFYYNRRAVSFALVATA